MENSLRLTIAQSTLHWEDTTRNLEMFTEKIADLPGKTDLVLLPEMFTTGFSMNPKPLAQTMDGPTITWMLAQARQLQAVIAGSVIVEEQGHYYNRFVWAQPDGKLYHYDKRHLFTHAGEHVPYHPGRTRLIIEWKGWKICPLVCYDLRFPVWSRNSEDFDLLCYVANWPAPRIAHWDQLLVARAIENQCYVAGVNRIGVDGNGHHYPGHSAMIDYSGEARICLRGIETVFTTTLTKTDLFEYRKKFAFLSDRDSFSVAD